MFMDKSFSLPSCDSSCSRFLKALQLEIDPWWNWAESSRALFEYEKEISSEYTQLCSRLSNFEGLVRFFAENRDNISREDMLATLPELESSLKRGMESMTCMIKNVQSLNCTSSNEPVKRGLANFASNQLGRLKAQFHIASTMYEHLFSGTFSSPKRNIGFR